MTATSADLTTDLYTHLLDYDLPGPERRRVEWLISEALADAYDKSGVDFGEQDFRQMLPHALGRTLVQLLAPIADSPHACAEIEFTRYVLDALYVRLGA